MLSLEETFRSRRAIQILRFLAGIRHPVSGNALARTLGLPQASVRLTLETLVRCGVIARQTVGRTGNYTINEKNAVVKGIVIPMFRREAALRDEIIDLLYNRTGDIAHMVTGVAVFGSLTQATYTWRDVDLLVLSREPALPEAAVNILNGLGDRLLQTYDLPLSLIVVSVNDVRASKRLIGEISGSAIRLHGTLPAPLAEVRHWRERWS